MVDHVTAPNFLEPDDLVPVLAEVEKHLLGVRTELRGGVSSAVAPSILDGPR